MGKKKASDESGGFEDDPERIRQELLPGPAPPPDDPATALQTIDDWNETWVSICDTQDTNRIVLTEELREFIEETKYLARWCESAGLDSSPLLEYAHNAWDTYYGFRPTLPHIPDALWVLLERLKYRLHPFQLRPFAEQTSATGRAASRSPPTRRTSWSGSSLSSTLMRRPAKSLRASVSPWGGSLNSTPGELYREGGRPTRRLPRRGSGSSQGRC